MSLTSVTALQRMGDNSYMVFRPPICCNKVILLLQFLVFSAAAFFQKSSFLCWHFFISGNFVRLTLLETTNISTLWLNSIQFVHIINWVYWFSECFRNSLCLKKKTSIVFMKFTDIYAWVPKLHLCDSGLNIIFFNARF